MAGKRPNKAGAHGKGNKRPPAPEQQAPYFLSLSLENVRCFGPKQTLDLSDGKGRPAQWTILLGENGTGKTTTLQSLLTFASSPPIDPKVMQPPTVMQPTVIARFSGAASRWDPNDPDYLFRRTGSQSPSRLAVRVVRGFAIDRIAGVPYEVPDPYEVPKYAPGDKVLSEPTTKIFVVTELASPICYAYGAGRRLGTTSLSRPAMDDPTASLFSDDVPLRNPEEWLLHLDYSASKPSALQQQQWQRLEQVKRLLLAILPEVDDIRFNPSGGVLPKPSVEFQTPYGWVPLRSLGYGYQTLIAWMVDCASRMVERYPDSADPLAEPAVVLVDEIDLHLHPQWQRKLIGHLTKHFPNTQFIVTAHSPLVVQAAKGANIALLRREGDHVVIDNDLKAIRGWRIDQIYTSDLFGLESARPPELDVPLKRRVEILSKPTLTAADRRELKALEKEIGELPVGESPEEIRDLALIRQTLDELKQARAAGS